MATDITKRTQGDLPQIAKLTFLPQWLAEQWELLSEDEQRRADGRFGTVKVLPEALLPTKEQREVIAVKIEEITQALTLTPEENPQFAAEATKIVAKMSRVLGARGGDVFAEEAKGEAYMIALSDVPLWALIEVQRKWYRRECRLDNEQIDFRWMPDPGTLRYLALTETAAVRWRATKLGHILSAVPKVPDNPEMAAKVEALPKLRTM